MKKILDFLKNLAIELIAQGKMLIGYFLLENPWLTDYPMLVSALQNFIENPSRETALVALSQAVLALGAGHRVVKILKKVLQVIKN